MSGATRRGRWRPAEETHAWAVMGGVLLDLRQAELDAPEVHIRAVAIMGGVDIIVPEGVRVEFSGLPIMGGTENKTHDVPLRAGAPVVHVRAVAFWGGVVVRHPRPDDNRELTDHHRPHPHHHIPPIPIPPIPVPPIPNPQSPPSPPPRPEPTPDLLERPPDLPNHMVADGTVTVMFTDVEGSSGIVERLGDRRAQEVMRAHNEIIRGQLAAHGGHEVKCQGDSFMVAFDSARRALRCAVAIQRAFEAYADKYPSHPLRVRCGLHTGEPIREEADLFGTSVIVAARIAGHARGGEILVSALLKDLVEGAGDFDFSPGQEIALKGLSRAHVVHRVRWEEEPRGT